MIKADKIFTFLTFGTFGYLYVHFAKIMLQMKPDGWYVGQINLYGDLVFHLTLINKFLATNKLIIDNPIMSGTPIGYPIFADFITAQISKTTNINFALFITTLSAGLLGIYVARLFIKTFIKNEKVVFLSLLLFFINGGLGFYYFFQDFFLSQKSLPQFLLTMPRQYTDLKDQGYWWINTYLAYFLPQRPFLFAFPITLIVLILLYKAIKKDKIKYFGLAGLLTGILPIVQSHSLILIFLISIMSAPVTILKSKNPIATFKKWLVFSILAFIIATPIIRVISPSINLSNFIKLAPGWTSKENIIWFWFKNLGIFGPMLIFALIWLYKKSRNLFYTYLPFLAIFFICNIFIFQPWNFDNSKLLVYWFFASCIVVAYFLYEKFFRETVSKKIIGVTLVFLMTFSGALDIYRTFIPITNYQIFSKLDLEVSQNVKNLTPPNSVFLTASNHNHPITALSGRSVVLGFEGWLWSHGVDYRERQKDVRTIYLGGKDAEPLIKQYHINYVTIGPLERAQFSINQTYFLKYPVKNLGQGWQIYDVSNIWTDGNR